MKRLFIIWCMVWCGLSLSAQFDPTNPPEPQTQPPRYTLTTTGQGGSASGAGRYAEGTTVNLRCSAAATNFYFQHWLKDGEVYSTTQNLTYTMEGKNTDFVAVFKFIPPSPNEPQTPPTLHRLYLNMSPEGCCSFNRTNGDRVEEESYVLVTAYPNQDFDFQGWYNAGVKVSDAISFNYLMPAQDVTLTARFVYNPQNPDDPSSAPLPQTLSGDANEDGSVDVTDAVLLINHYLAGTVEKLKRSAADMNSDRTVDVTDAVAIVNKYLNN